MLSALFVVWLPILEGKASCPLLPPVSLVPRTVPGTLVLNRGMLTEVSQLRILGLSASFSSPGTLLYKSGMEIWFRNSEHGI